jgi:hypothetical protein
MFNFGRYRAGGQPMKYPSAGEAVERALKGQFSPISQKPIVKTS